MEQIIVKELIEYDVFQLFHEKVTLNFLGELEEKNNQLKQKLGLRMDAITVYKKNRKHMIKFVGIAGVCGVGKYEIEIIPKFYKEAVSWRESLFNMIRISNSDRIYSQRSNNMASAKMTFYDHVALSFIDELNKAISKEAIHNYRTIEDSSRFQRGRLLIREQLKNVVAKPGVLYYEHDVFDCNNKFNYLLNWCLDTLAVKVNNNRIRNTLKEYKNFLPQCTTKFLVPVDEKLPPQYAHYESAIEIANNLALGYSSVYRSKGDQGYGYIVNTEVIYEKFIEKLLKHIQSSSYDFRSEAQSSIIFAKNESKGVHSYYTVPDNKIYIDNGPAMLIDAKYKNNFVNGKGKKPVNSDVYQMFSSLVAHKCNIGVLVSPCESQESMTKLYWTIKNDEKEYRICSLSVDLSDISTNAKIRELEDQILRFILDELEIEVNNGN